MFFNTSTFLSFCLVPFVPAYMTMYSLVFLFVLLQTSICILIERYIFIITVVVIVVVAVLT